eukprot:877668-Pyramimonas_sp.AAC.1
MASPRNGRARRRRPRGSALSLPGWCFKDRSLRPRFKFKLKFDEARRDAAPAHCAVLPRQGGAPCPR